MLSEHPSIDEFFRNKEEDFAPVNSREDAHWQQMKTMLAGSPATPPHKKKRRRMRHRVVKYICGCAVIVLVTTLAITTSHPKKRTTKTTTKISTHKNIAATRPVKTTASKPDTVTRPVTPSQHPTHRTTQFKPSAVKTATAPTAPRNADTATKSSPDAATLLKLFYQQIEPQPQEFMIQNDRDTTLVAQEGTQLHIPAGAFRNKKGLVPSGTIKIILTEYYGYDKIVAAGLSTGSNGQQLVSGGMVHITAEADGQELSSDLAVNISIKMPTNNYDPRMQLFIGNTPNHMQAASFPVPENQRGDTAGTASAAIATQKRINWIPVATSSSNNQQTVKVMDLRDNAVSVSFRKRNAKETATYIISGQSWTLKDTIKKQLEKRYGSHYDEIKVVRRRKFNPLGIFGHRPGNRPTVGDSVYMTYDEALKSNLISKEDSIVLFNHPPTYKIAYTSLYVDVVPSYLDTLSLEKPIEKSPLLKNKKYSFALRRLGWINCDRFYSDPRPRLNFTINPGQNCDTGQCISQLVFTRYCSVMEGYYRKNTWLFNGIPENEPVQLICVGVKNGKVVSCIQPLTTSVLEVNNLHFEATTPQEFKNKLKALNRGLEN